MQADGAGERELGIEVGGGDADACRGGGEIALGAADVGATLEQLRGESSGHGRRRRQGLVACDAKLGRNLAAENGERVLGGAALTVDNGEVVAREFEFGARTGDIHFIGKTALEA